jgi:ketosteroid isomerase-like protein
MMRTTSIIIRFPLLFLLINSASCYFENQTDVTEDQIIELERKFMSKVDEWGIRDAFVHFADEDAILVRNNRLIRGRKEIADFYSQSGFRNVQLSWKPDIVRIAECGDLAYTVGMYVYTSEDSTGNVTTFEGVFHTIWKKQEDGSWKYVYD